MATYARQAKNGPIHILNDNGEARCFGKRFDTSGWEQVDPLDLTPERICHNCASFSNKQRLAMRQQLADQGTVNRIAAQGRRRTW